MTWLRSCRSCGEDVELGESCRQCYNSPERRRRRERRRNLQGFGRGYSIRTFRGEADAEKVAPTILNSTATGPEPLNAGQLGPEVARQRDPRPERPPNLTVTASLPTASQSKAYLDAAGDGIVKMLTAFESPPSGAVKLVFVENEPGKGPVQLAAASVFRVPVTGEYVMLDRKPNERLPVKFIVREVDHIVVVNTASPNQTVVVFLEAVEGKPVA